MCVEVPDAQFGELTCGTANRCLVTFEARLGVVERTQSIGSDVFDFLEEFLVRLAAVRIGKPVALFVETCERFGRLRRCLAARMSCEAKEGGDCDEEQQLRGLHQTLRFTARSLQIKILILFAGVNKFFSVVLENCRRLTGHYAEIVVETSPLRSQPGSERNRLCLLKKSGLRHAFCPFWACGLVASLVSPDQVHAVAICGVGLLLRNRTSRFRFCTVAAR